MKSKVIDDCKSLKDEIIEDLKNDAYTVGKTLPLETRKEWDVETTEVDNKKE